MHRTLSRSLALATALLVCGLGPQADAIEVHTGAAGACRSALPIFDGNIRTRPLAVQNEGNASAFISCTNSNVAGNVVYRNTVVGVFIKNNRLDDIAVSCTFIDGTLSTSPVFYPSTQTFTPGLGDFIVWTAPMGAPFTQFANFSCNLPPGVGISRIAFVYPGPP